MPYDAAPPPERVAPSALREGDVDPETNRKIETLVLSADRFVVYLDEEGYVWWRTTPDYPDEQVEGFGAAMNRVGILEVRSATLLAAPHLQALRRMLGEGVARLLDDENARAANGILDDAARYLEARAAERARTWYVSAAAVTAAVLLAAAAVVWLFRDGLGYAVHRHPVELALTALLGSLGALISVLRRSGALPIDAAAGRAAHFLEGAARIVLGTAGAFLVGLAIKANLIFGVIETAADGGSRLALLAAACIVAGASERMVPDLIQRVEATAAGSGKAEGEGKGGEAERDTKAEPAAGDT